MRGQVLLIDDDYTALISNFKLFQAILPEYTFHMSSTAPEALKMAKSLHPEVVLLDLVLNPLENVESGFKLLSALQEHDSSSRIIVLTGYDDEAHGVRAINQGAASFVPKQCTHEHLAALIKDGTSQAQLRRAYNRLRDKQSNNYEKLFPGSSKFNQELMRTFDFAIQSDQAILITGETGTGKGYFAELVHRFSRRAENNFVRLQPIYSNTDLLNSELFGHHKGSFTGANYNRSGLFEQADNGTLFLDEVDCFSQEVQVALLGVLQSKSFRPIGSNQEVSSNFRLISASNQNLEESLDTRRLRQDLYYRLAHFRIHLKALAERPEDIPAISQALLKKLAPKIKIDIHPKVTDTFLNYNWPGNIRELESIIQHATNKALFEDRRQIITDDISYLGSNQHANVKDFHAQVNSFKSQLIRAALTRHQNSHQAAAKALGIDRGTIKRILQLEPI